MQTLWCHNGKTGEIFSYRQDGEWNDFPRGTFLAYGDYLTTGFASKDEAEQWAVEWHACPKCKEMRKAAVGTQCWFCRTVLV